MSLLDLERSIVAIASPTSPALRGIVRLSGNDVGTILQRMGIDPPPGSSPESETATVIRPRRFDTSLNLGDPIGLVDLSVLWWRTQQSYTGQPAAELHTIGSLPVLTGVVDAAISGGARAARPGEFTMRAFLAGRLDLTQAEAVLGVIEAEQRGTLEHALQQLAGNLSRPLERMRSELLDLLADVEAGLDFVDEDIEFISDEVLIERLRQIDHQLADTWRMMRQRGGGAARPVIVIRGEPNAGKSYLMNRLADAQAAIVADLPGTTRDIVTSEAVIAARSVTLVDTAGIEEGQGEVDLRSQAQARRVSAEACVRLWCVDRSRDDFDDAADKLRQVASAEQRDRVANLWVATKNDLVPNCDNQQADSHWIVCSAVSGDGIESLRRAIDLALSRRDAEETGSVVGTAARCRDSIRQAREAIDQAILLTETQSGHELVATELRTTAQCLGEVTGAVYTDDILDRVFSRFCIGK